MAIYQGMDLGTAKPSDEQRAAVPHHLLDLVEPTVEFSVSDYLTAAQHALDLIRSHGATPIFSGGTPMWLVALIRGMYLGPPADWEFRRQVAAEIEENGVEALRQRLWQVDPLAAHKLHTNDVRRMIRALEVAHLTGKPLSHQQSQFEQPRRPEDCRVFVLSWPREELHARINRRVECMFAAGLAEEVRGLLDRYGELGRTAMQAVGYRETIAMLRGELTLVQTIEQVKAHTRQLAKRQETWFRSLPEARWIRMDQSRTVEKIADELLHSVN